MSSAKLHLLQLTPDFITVLDDEEELQHRLLRLGTLAPLNYLYAIKIQNVPPIIGVTIEVVMLVFIG